ncbi:MAG: tetratricopeptide repeat protein [Bacteroidetes bacterium]|nr:tetratricopeptide repeat protein [Bacteroidota bacterium]
MVKAYLKMPIKTLNEYVDAINSINSQGDNLSKYIFRGQANAQWPVTSGVVRRLSDAKKSSGYPDATINSDEIILYLEDSISEARKREDTHPVIKGMSDLRLLAEMQHFGASTLLIDFSYSSLVALYMAASDYAGINGEDGKVYCMNYNKRSIFNEIVDFKEWGDIENTKKIGDILNQLKDKIQTYRPYHSNSRIIKQESIFIFNSKGIIENEQIDFEIIIDKMAKENIMSELGIVAGIHEESIYPDFLGYLQANNAKRSYKMKNPFDYYQMGKVSHQKAKLQNDDLGLYKNAVEYYSKAIELDKNLAEAFFERGYIYLTIYKNYEDAIISFSSAIKLKPKDADLWYNRGIAYEDKFIKGGRTTDFNQAIANYKKAMTLDKKNIKPINNLANLYNITDKFELALKYFKLGQTIDKNDADLWFGLGEVNFNLKNYKIALTKFSKAFEINPKDDSAVCHMGHCYLKLKQLKQAEECFSKGFEINSKNDECCNFLGVVFFKLGKIGKAQEYLSQCIQLNQEYYAQAFNNIGFCYLSVKNLNDAEQNITKAIELGCKDFGNKSMGHYYLCKGDKLKAIENYRISINEFDSIQEFWKEFYNDYADLNLYKNYKISESDFKKLKKEIE